MRGLTACARPPRRPHEALRSHVASRAGAGVRSGSVQLHRRGANSGVFHERARLLDEELQRGSRVLIHHNFLRAYRQRRVATINALREYEIGWDELAERGTDFFPHSQRFRIEPVSSCCCLFSNRIGGRVDVPAAPLWWMPWFRLAAPTFIDDELRQIAEAIPAQSRTARTS